MGSKSLPVPESALITHTGSTPSTDVLTTVSVNSVPMSTKQEREEQRDRMGRTQVFAE